MEIAQILIVEDDRSFSDLLQFQLSTLGFKIGDSLSVQSIKEAKEASEEFSPDLILLDLNILDSNGIMTYDAINRLFSDCSVIVLSGMDDQNLAAEVVSKGAQDYLLKSEIRPQLLEKTIRYGILRKTLSHELEHSEKKYRDVFNNSPIPMFKLEGEALQIQMANEASQSLYQLDEKSIIGKSFYDFNYKDSFKFENLTKKSSYRKEFSQKKNNGDDLIVELSINKLEQKKLSFIAHVIDKTEEVLFEKNKFDIISKAEESEKKKIARELHDGIGQNMVLLNLLFQNINVSEQQKEQHVEVGKIIQNCIKEIKEIAYNLLPPELERGFLNAINRFANRINATGRIEFFIEIEKNVSEEDISHIDKFNLYRIVQEIINNAIKHSRAEHIYFRLKKENKQIKIEIEDDGIGFDETKIKEGLGIQNVKHRMKIAKLNGEFNSVLDKGTKIKLLLELTNQEKTY